MSSRVNLPPERPVAISIENMSAVEALGDDGPLSKTLSGYQSRAAQIDMAATIEDVIVNKDTLVAEAGTGIGKTFAYLAPILLSAKLSPLPKKLVCPRHL